MTGAELALVIIACVASGVAIAFGSILLYNRRVAVAKPPIDPKRVRAMNEEAQKTVDPQEVVEQGARVIDPAKPPYYADYTPSAYDPDRAPKCSCHQRRVEHGDRVLLWPIPDHPDGAIDIFCQDTYGTEGVPK